VIDRSLMREMLPSLVLAIAVSTFLLLIRQFFVLADLFISHTFSGAVTLRVLLLAIPHVLALTIPMGILFAVLVTASRWAGDSELVALQSAGLSATRAARPLVLVAALFMVLDLGLTWQVLPRANRALQKLTLQVALSGARAAVEPRIFAEDFPGQLLFVNRIDRHTGVWHGVLLFDESSASEERLVIAESGELVSDQRDGGAWLDLQDATTHLLRPNQPQTYQQNFNHELKILLTPPSAGQAKHRFGERETDSMQLLRSARNGSLKPKERQEALIELNKRVAIPAAAVAFALVAFPLGARNRRGGRGFALTASVGIVVVYYVLLNNGEILAPLLGLPPALGVWLPNLALLALALAMLRRASRGSYGEGFRRSRRAPRGGSRGVVSGGAASDESAAGKGRRNRRTTREGRPAPFRRQGFLLPFLGIVDRHLVSECLRFFALVLTAVCALYIAVNLSENLDEIQRHAVPFLVVVSYYLFSLPQILHDVLPLGFVIAFLGTAAILERHNETTALKAAGVSLTRAAAPLLLLGAVLGLTLFVLDESVVQRANRASQRLEDIIKGRKVARSYRSTDRLWLFLPDGRTLVNFLQFDPDTDTLVRPSIYIFDDEMNLRARYMADRATYHDGHWRASGTSWSRTFLAGGSPEFVPNVGKVDLPISVKPSYFGREYRKPSQMSLGELRDYIHTLKAAGYRVDRWRVQFEQKLAYPASLVVLAWLALPFAFRFRKRGTVVGVALALVLGMVYFAVMAFTTKLGEAGLITPLLGAWTPPVVFGLLALNLHTTLRT
jgi:lipopolysaccharide export system permease protein